MPADTHPESTIDSVILGSDLASHLPGDSDEERSGAARLAIAVDLFLKGRVGAPEAAAMAHLPQGAFLDAVAARHAAATLASQPLPGLPGEGFKLTVLMPVFNEKATLLEILRRVLAVPGQMEVIVVDDGSTDGTRDLLAAEVEGRLPGVRVLYHERNRGKGAAIRTAIPHITGDAAVIQDADLEYSPEEFPGLLQPIIAGYADVVYGSRFLGGPHRVLFFWHAVGNRWLTTLSNMMTNLNLTDMETCYKAFRSDLLKSVVLRSDRFGIEPELTAKVARRGARVYEVPISYRGRTYREGKKIGWRDGLTALWCILKYHFVD